MKRRVASALNVSTYVWLLNHELSCDVSRYAYHTRLLPLPRGFSESFSRRYFARNPSFSTTSYRPSSVPVSDRVPAVCSSETVSASPPRYGVAVHSRCRARYCVSFVASPPANPLGQRSSSYSHESIDSFAAFSVHAT